MLQDQESDAVVERLDAGANAERGGFAAARTLHGGALRRGIEVNHGGALKAVAPRPQARLWQGLHRTAILRACQTAKSNPARANRLKRRRNRRRHRASARSVARKDPSRRDTAIGRSTAAARIFDGAE